MAEEALAEEALAGELEVAMAEELEVAMAAEAEHNVPSSMNRL